MVILGRRVCQLLAVEEREGFEVVRKRAKGANAWVWEIETTWGEWEEFKREAEALLSANAYKILRSGEWESVKRMLRTAEVKKLAPFREGRNDKAL